MDVSGCIAMSIIGLAFFEINGTRYSRVVLAPLDGHEKHVRFRPI